MTDRKFDWIRSTDPRNDEHLARAVLPTIVPRRTKEWAGPYLRLDQGSVGACVGFGWTTEAMSTPVRFRPSPYSLEDANRFALDRYHRAQQLDEWAGEDYEGSSVNGGGKAMREAGYITGWRWHQSVDDIVDALIVDGPQVMGSAWLAGMFNPDDRGVIRATGASAGGHCYCLTGYRTSYAGFAGVVRIRNSWGSWGLNGDAFLPVDDLRGLWSDGAECAMPIGRAYGRTSG